MSYQKLSKEQELQLVQEYKNGVNVQTLMSKYGFASKKSITDKVKKYFPEEYQTIIKTARENRKGYSYSMTKLSNQFDAYFLGLLLTDGYIAREREVGIDLIDEDCIAFLSKVIGKEYRTYEGTTNKTMTPQKRHRLILSDLALVQDIARFGIIPNKTDILTGPKLLPEEEQFIPYIIRGIIDGDGCIFETSYGAPAFYIITKSKSFADWLVDVLTNKLYMQDIRITMNKDGLYRIETAHQANILKLLVLCYDKPYGMSRKYLKLQKMFRDYNSDLLLSK